MGKISDKGTGERGKWVWRDGKFVDISQVKPKQVEAPAVRKDEVDMFWNHVRDCPETSMSTYRRHLKEDGFEEKPPGFRDEYKKPTRQQRMDEIREDVEEAKRQIKYGVAKSSGVERQVWELQNQGRHNEAKEIWDNYTKEQRRKSR